jgi:hypothetical protein
MLPILGHRPFHWRGPGPGPRTSDDEWIPFVSHGGDGIACEGLMVTSVGGLVRRGGGATGRLLKLSALVLPPPGV